MELIKLLTGIILIMISFPKEMFCTKNSSALTDVEIKNSFLNFPDIIPKHYDIQLKVDIDKSTFYGISKINISIYRDAHKITLHSTHLKILYATTVTEIDMHGNTKRNIQINAYKDLYDLELISLFFQPSLSPGNYTLKMEFEGIISDHEGGFFKAPFIKENDKGWFVATHNWPTGIRRTFPCWDIPEVKATFEISVEHHKSYMVISIIFPYKISFKPNDLIKKHFKFPPIPTYLITMVLYNRSIRNIITIGKINLNCKPELTYDLQFAGHVIANITNYFLYQWKLIPSELMLSEHPMEHFAVPGLIDDGLENLGFVFYRDEDITYNKTLHPIARKMEVARLIGRKTGSHMLRSTGLLSYFWLNEGIVTVLFTSDIINKIIPDSRISDLFVVQLLQESLYLDDQGIMNPLISKYNTRSDINSAYFFSSYIKATCNHFTISFVIAPAILRMLQYILSDRVFRNGINMYLRRQLATRLATKLDTLNDFLADMQYAHDEATGKFNLTEIIYPWIEQNHYPIVNVYYTQCILMKNCFTMMRESTSNTSWSIPITFVTASNIKSNTSLSNFTLIKSRETHIPLGSNLEDDWILLNLQQAGYYRVNYDIKIWEKIAEFLNSKQYKKIHVLNRAQLIDDAFYFTIMGQLDITIFLDLTKYLWREKEYVPWYPMIKIIERISYIIPISIEGKYFQIPILDQLDSLLQAIGYDETLNDHYFIKCLRIEAVKWACILNHPKCKAMAMMKLYSHLKNPVSNKILPGWKKWIYYNGLPMTYSPLVFEHIYNMYLNETRFKKDKRNSEYLEYLACFEYFDIYPTNITSKNYNGSHLKEIREDSISNINFFHYIVAKHARKDLVLDHMLANWNIVKPKEISTLVALNDIINHVYSKEQIEKIKIFLKGDIGKIKVSDLYSNLYNQSFEFMMKLISYVENKTDIRLLEIKNRTNTYVSSLFGIKLTEN